jgi:hypothetical protein
MNDCDEFTFLHRSNRLHDRYRQGHSVDVTEMHVASLSACNAIAILHRTMIVRSAGCIAVDGNDVLSILLEHEVSVTLPKYIKA